MAEKMADLESQVAANVARQVAEHHAEVVARYGLDPCALQFVSGSIQDLLGYSPEELYATPDMVGGLAHPEDALALKGSFGRQPAVVEIRVRHRDGYWVWVELRVAPTRDDNGVPVAMDVVARHIGGRKEAEEVLALRALHDPLTGLPNRTLLLDRLEGAISRARRGGRTVAVLLLDVDRFKLVNDTYGHAAGDELLSALAQRLSGALRATDTVGRIGGDEFVIVCDGLASVDDAMEMCERVKGPLAEPVDIGDCQVQVSASIGLAIGGPDATPEQMLGQADAAMYRAKEQGRNRAEVYDETIHERARRRLELEAALRDGLREGLVEVHYQPIVSVTDGRVVECEALARWTHRGEEVGPQEFVAVAEDAGLIGELTRSVMTDACRQACSWPDGLAVSVNLSPRQLAQPDIVALVAQVLAETGLAPERLCLEITESAMVDDLDLARASLTGLHRLGVRLSLDDFGIGYSSLLHLRRLPLHQLKVDRSFVAGLGREPSDTAIVAGVVGLGHALGMLVVAEGVETETHVAELRALSCELGQGHYWCPPLPGPDLQRWLRHHPAARAESIEVDLRHDGDVPRVLLVDDASDMRYLMRTAITTSGAALQVVGEAGDGTEAVAAAARLQPDVILLDLVMPDGGGLEVLPQLRRVSPDSRILVMSGFVSPGLEQALLEGGASGYVTKAMPMPVVVRRVLETAAEAEASTPLF